MLFATLPNAMERRLGTFIVQALAKTAWAFGTATQADAMLFIVHALANTAWAFGTATQAEAMLFATLARG